MNYDTTPNTANHAAMRPTTTLRHALIYSVAVLRCDCLSEVSGGVSMTRPHAPGYEIYRQAQSRGDRSLCPFDRLNLEKQNTHKEQCSPALKN
jgi:hypothetical protein